MSLERAFDSIRFGAGRTLNLRAMQPTALQAVQLCEQWLREQQVQGAEEALVITGRGNNSFGGYSPVRESVARLLPSLRRRNVIGSYAEHTPGSFVVTFAPVRALFEVPRRRREKGVATSRAGQTGASGQTASPAQSLTQSAPASLAALEEETVRQLADLAEVSLAALGLRSPTRAQVEDEMIRQFHALQEALPTGSDREALLQQAIMRAAEEYEGD